ASGVVGDAARAARWRRQAATSGTAAPVSSRSSTCRVPLSCVIRRMGMVLPLSTGKAFQHGYGVQRRRAPPAHGRRGGRCHREPSTGEGVSSRPVGGDRPRSPLTGMRILTVHITTEIIFALSALLGFRFAPRLRDLNDRRLFASGSIDMQRYPRLQAHIPGRINRPRMLDWWDDMLRVAGSIKLGWVTASLLVQKLQAY